MTKGVKRPVLKRYPKRPKATASLEAWHKFDAKCKEAEKENASRMAKYHAEVKAVKAAKDAKEKIMEKTKGLTGVAGKEIRHVSAYVRKPVVKGHLQTYTTGKRKLSGVKKKVASKAKKTTKRATTRRRR